ncbi:hypothetical protein [Halopenitus persicus]|uniref:hypothetical protein n=1 Tax=Halopenitus persicus TaxID=1048396 RepID=UPI000BBB4F36|nr:hypothetical protein [Halopenitus persicus]
MEDIPQPADAPYQPGDRVRVYLAEDDPDAEHHGRVCEVVERLADSLAEETGRQLDGHLYRVQDATSGKTLPVDFRHADLVPHEGETP